MTDLDHSHGRASGEQLVRRPRATDAVGRALRNIFAPQHLPAEMTALIARLDAPSR